MDPLKTGNVVDLVEDRHGKDFPDTWNGTEQMEQVLVVDLGFSGQIKFEVGDDFIVVAYELEVDLDAFGCAIIRELLRHPFTVGSISDSLLWRGQIVLVVGVLDMRHQLTAMTDQAKSSSEQVSSRTPF